MNVVLLDQPAPSNTNLLPKKKLLTCSKAKLTSVSCGAFGLAFAFVVGMILATVVNEPLPGPVASRPTILLLGDSLTQSGEDTHGWATHLRATYVRSVDVVNRGLSSYTTRTFLKQALPVVSRELETSLAPVLITLWLGANDAVLADGPEGATKHVPLDEYRSNLAQIVNELHRVAPQAKLLVLSPPVIDDDVRRRYQVAAGGKADPIDRTNAQTALYAMACGGFVGGLTDDRVAFLDVHSFMMTAFANATARAALLSDGLHLSAEGNRVVFEQVRDRVQAMLLAELLDTPQIPVL